MKIPSVDERRIIHEMIESYAIAAPLLSSLGSGIFGDANAELNSWENENIVKSKTSPDFSAGFNVEK